MRPLAYTFPYAVVFWIVFFWAFLREAGIVNRAQKGAANMGAYIASKSAVMRLTETMAAELRAMGAQMTETPDGMVIQGLGRHQEHGRLTANNGQSHGDHRVAMSIAIGGLTGSKEMMVHDTDCVETSFPGFHRTLLDVLKSSR